MRGLNRMAELPDVKHHPNPLEFARLCEPSPADYGLPSIDEAHKLACLNYPDWKTIHPIIYHARIDYGVDELTRLPPAKTKEKFKKIYLNLFQQLRRGRRFEIPAIQAPVLAYKPRQLESNTNTPASITSDPRANLERIKRILKPEIKPNKETQLDNAA